MRYASDPAFAVDDDMRVVGWNEGAANLLGYTSAEAMGQRCGQVLQAFYTTGEPLCSMLCEGRACVAVGEKWNMPACRIRHKSGEMISAGISTLVMPPDVWEESDSDAVAVIFMRKANGQTNVVAPISPLRPGAIWPGHQW